MSDLSMTIRDRAGQAGEALKNAAITARDWTVEHKKEVAYTAAAVLAISMISVAAAGLMPWQAALAGTVPAAAILTAEGLKAANALMGKIKKDKLAKELKDSINDLRDAVNNNNSNFDQAKARVKKAAVAYKQYIRDNANGLDGIQADLDKIFGDDNEMIGLNPKGLKDLIDVVENKGANRRLVDPSIEAFKTNTGVTKKMLINTVFTIPLAEEARVLYNEKKETAADLLVEKLKSKKIDEKQFHAQAFDINENLPAFARKSILDTEKDLYNTVKKEKVFVTDERFTQALGCMEDRLVNPKAFAEAILKEREKTLEARNVVLQEKFDAVKALDKQHDVEIERIKEALRSVSFNGLEAHENVQFTENKLARIKQKTFKYNKARNALLQEIKDLQTEKKEFETYLIKLHAENFKSRYKVYLNLINADKDPAERLSAKSFRVDVEAVREELVKGHKYAEAQQKFESYNILRRRVLPVKLGGVVPPVRA